MRIGIFGATGTIGRRIVAEALSRGHQITALARDASRIGQPCGGVTWKVADILRSADIAAVLDELDVLVNAFGPGPSFDALKQNPADAIAEAVGRADSLRVAARALLTALADRRPSLRLIVVGGAASLELRPGLQFNDAEVELRAALNELGLPDAYTAVIEAHRDALNLFRLSDRNWTYFSPAVVTAPGERTGRFRIATNQPVIGADGVCRISAEDYAIALVDEIELPCFVQRRFTIGY
jgi:putative NADH-flavin reductase